MISARWLILGVVLQAVTLAAAIFGNYLLTLHLIQQRQDTWCPALSLIVATPPPAGTPKGERDLFTALSHVHNQLGC